MPEPDADIATRPVSRPPSAWLAAAAVFLIGTGIACAFWMYHPFVIRPWTRPWDLGDLTVYRAAGRAITHGHSVYGSYVHDQLANPLPFIYPPIAAVFAVPLSLIPETPANLLWTAITVAVLAGIVRVCFAPLLERYDRARPIAWILAVGAMAALSPVEDHLRFGQVGIVLMACCVFDCAVRQPRWPRGLLIGAAAAIKLVPAIFIPYLVLTRRWRAAGVATVTFVGLTFAGVLVAPSDSWKFFTDTMFDPQHPDFFTNQSIQGILERAMPSWRLIWIATVAVIVVFGLWRAAAAGLAGDEMRGIAIIGLIGALVSPLAWVHHLVWIIPVLAVLVGRGDNKRRLVVAFVVACAFVARLPYVGNDELHSKGLLAGLLIDSYGLLCIGLLVYLTDAVPLARRALARREPARV